jgi:hypothetical protein
MEFAAIWSNRNGPHSDYLVAPFTQNLRMPSQIAISEVFASLPPAKAFDN